jgi:ABC-type phosphate transport system permease subunit
MGKAERRVGKDDEAYHRAVAAHEEAEADYARVTKEAEKEFQTLRREIDRINSNNGRYQLLLTTAGEGHTAPATTLMRLDGIARAYPANRLTTTDKLGVYFSRWWEFLSAEPREANSEGGVFPAIFGTVVMTFIMIIVVVPFGVLASLYLREYARSGPVVSAVRIAVNNLAGVPSIVFGVFGLGFFCYGVGSYVDAGPSVPMAAGSWITFLVVTTVVLVAGIVFWRAGLVRITWESTWQLRYFKAIFITVWVSAMLVCAFLLVAQNPFFEGLFRARLPNPTYGKGGLLWASLTLALLTLPVVIVATEEALSAVPNSMREGSYACGASKWQTIKRIVLPRAMPGIMTGTVLAMARGAGEVAPLMLVGAVKLAPELPLDGLFPYLHPERSFMHLGFHIYDVGFQSQNSEAAKPMVYTTTMLLILLIVIMNLAAIFLRNRLRRKFVSQTF